MLLTQGLILLVVFLFSAELSAQTPGGDERRGEPTVGVPQDTLFVFSPARPLIDTSEVRTSFPSALGASVTFGSSGYGVGFFWERKLSRSLSLLVDVVITGVRGGDELEVYNNNPESVHYQSFFVPGKVNRVWQAPTMVGLRKELFRDVFFDNFRPFAALGAGLSTVLLTPYDQGFFGAFGSATWRFAPGGYVGLGAEVTAMDPGIGIGLRYYYIPIKPGVESMEDEPITNLGGVFLGLDIPF